MDAGDALHMRLVLADLGGAELADRNAVLPAALDQGVQPGQLGALDLSVLVNQWPGDLYNAFVFATGEQVGGGPAALGALQRVPPPSPTGGGGLQWRNAAYALQWWIFALFAAWMWFKMVRDDWLTGQAARSATREDVLAEQEKDTSDATP